MIKFFVKRYIISKVNDLLRQATAKCDLAKVADTIDVWTMRLRRILACLSATTDKLKDGELSSDEADVVLADVENIIKEW